MATDFLLFNIIKRTSNFRDTIPITRKIKSEKSRNPLNQRFRQKGKYIINYQRNKSESRINQIKRWTLISYSLALSKGELIFEALSLSPEKIKSEKSRNPLNQRFRQKGKHLINYRSNKSESRINQIKRWTLISYYLTLSKGELNFKRLSISPEKIKSEKSRNPLNQRFRQKVKYLNNYRNN
jgi:hypothetical protein